MIRRPGRLANGRLELPVADHAARERASELADAARLDLGVAAANVARAGGDAALFRTALAAGLAARASTSDEVAGGDGAGVARAVLDLAAIAGWRAGALGLRHDALTRLGALRADGAMHAAAAATLGFDVDVLDEFLERQAVDRYWWPGRALANGYVAAVGGFVGFGGSWIAPADRWFPLPGDGAFALRSAGEWWRLDADAWGTRLVRLGAPEPGPGAETPGVTLSVDAGTHLVWLHVREGQ